ncbi:MAG: PaaI family thioesterase [Caulobacteraceae bacterium]|jgi:uncharacterized protein (TIGR00369 family)
MSDADSQARQGLVQEGDWAGWTVWGSDPFELLAGPYYARRGEDGRMVCAFKAERKHMNGHGAMHGGCLMTFADYAVFAIASEHLGEGSAVTVQMNCDFVDAALEGERVECVGEVTRAGGSLVFARGVVTAAGRRALTWSAILKKVKRR